MKKRQLAVTVLLAAVLLTFTSCGREKTYQKEITEAWTRTNAYESASFSYESSYTDEDGINITNNQEGAYNHTEDAFRQVSAYGTQGSGKQEQVFLPEENYIRYNLTGEAWGSWTPVGNKAAEYPSFLTTLFEQEISFENIDSIKKTEEDGEYLYTLTYKKSYMKERVEDQLEAARSYLEIYKESASNLSELETLEKNVAYLEKRAEATGMLLYYVDKEGNLTGLGSRLEMEGGGSYAMLRLSDLGKVSFEGYVEK